MKIAEYLETSVLAKLEEDIKQLERKVVYRREAIDLWVAELRKDESLLAPLAEGEELYKSAKCLEPKVLSDIEQTIESLKHNISNIRESVELWAAALKKEEALLEEAMEIRAKLLKIIDFCYSW